MHAPLIRGLNIPELLRTGDLATVSFTSHDYAILPVHIAWLQLNLNYLLDYTVHILGFGGKDLSDLQVYVTLSADAVPSCCEIIQLSEVDVLVCSFTLVLLTGHCTQCGPDQSKRMLCMPGVFTVFLRFKKEEPSCGLSQATSELLSTRGPSIWLVSSAPVWEIHIT
jgi:hypothetical protein